jgi:LPS-assembly protein
MVSSLVTSQWFLISIGLISFILSLVIHQTFSYSAQLIDEPVHACVVARDVDLTDALRAKFAQCLGWQSDQSTPICLGAYQPISVNPLANPDEIRIMADNVSFYRDKRSSLLGHVEVQQTQKIVNAQTAYVYRDSKTNQVTKIEFLDEVRYLEPDKLMIARKVTLNPQDKSGQITDALYRFNTERRQAILPAWGRASLIQRFANKDYLLRKATYTTCAPQDKAWDIQASSLYLDDAKATGVARNATVRIHEWPVFYTPYLSFPTNKERKSGFLLPLVGYSNVGGFDFGLPYYLNLAPNYDLTLTPHSYSERGVMLGGEFRSLTSHSSGVLTGNFLPNDRAFGHFLANNETQFPQLQYNSTNRWSVGVLEAISLAPNVQFNVNAQKVSDDYYLQDFSSNLAQITQRQLLRQADLIYSTENWVFRGMVQSYETLHPVNEPPVASVYERLPQLMAQGMYYDLPMNATLNILGQYDKFHWPTESWSSTPVPQGPRLHFNPVASVPLIKSWGYITPSIQFVENYYEVQNNQGFSEATYNRTIPRYSVDSGLYFERDFNLQNNAYTQTLEPRLFYLRVPYQNQTPIPVYDSGYMIFNEAQLFRTNRFSGFDRIGDANQLAYALTSRWLSEATGVEKANFSIGQIKYFSDRKVLLCQNVAGLCVDNPYAMGYLSPTFGTSPVASRAAYHFNSQWAINGDYIWDPATKATNNADLNLHYQPAPNAVISTGYSYLVNADITQVRANASQNNDLHQAIVAFAWPMTEKWSTVGAYSHNISKSYNMMSLVGLQYDSCCWAMRVLGGRTFKNLNAQFEPLYNNNVYVQILLKGLGSVANSDPYNILNTYIPGYNDPFSG